MKLSAKYNVMQWHVRYNNGMDVVQDWIKVPLNVMVAVRGSYPQRCGGVWIKPNIEVSVK